MGDFYEMFFEDAEVASRALGIVLTKRGKYLGKDVPLCGVPVVRADEYLHRLIALGHRVAVCEQLEDPAEARKRGSKSVVRRDVIRLVTPGTLTEDTLLDAGCNNYLLAVARTKLSSAQEDTQFALAWIDISTGEFRVTECDHASLSAEIARLEPGEIIVSDALFSEADLAGYWRSLPVVMPCSTAPPPSAGSRPSSRWQRARPSARFRAWNSPPPQPASLMSSARSSASIRRCRRPCAKRPPPAWRSTRRPAPISN
jgi:DNA mismatch repair protein MutS